MHQHHQPSPTTPCFRKSFSKSDQVRFDNSFAEYSAGNSADIPNPRLSPTGLKPYRLMSINRDSFRVPPGSDATMLIQIQVENDKSLHNIIYAHLHLSQRKDN